MKPWHNARVSDTVEPIDAASEKERAWLSHSAALWRRAHGIAREHPSLDVGDAYHVLRTLELPPAERLRRGLTRVRARPHDS